MNDWKRHTLCALGQGLELSEATYSDNIRLRLHLGTWTASNNHTKWSGWLQGYQLRRLYDYLGNNPQLMEGQEPPEPPTVDPANPWA